MFCPPEDCQYTDHPVTCSNCAEKQSTTTANAALSPSAPAFSPAQAVVPPPNPPTQAPPLTQPATLWPKPQPYRDKFDPQPPREPDPRRESMSQYVGYAAAKGFDPHTASNYFRHIWATKYPGLANPPADSGEEPRRNAKGMVIDHLGIQ